MTYVIFELARHPECQESIVLADLSSSSPVTIDSLRDAIHAESFIREVLRMKGEAITTVRSPRHDLELAGYFIPEGMSCHVFSSISHHIYLADTIHNRSNESQTVYPKA